MGIHGQELISESVPVYLRVLDINDPVSSIALYYFAVIGERIDDLNDLDPQAIPLLIQTEQLLNLRQLNRLLMPLLKVQWKRTMLI